MHGSVLAALGTGIVSRHYQTGRALTLDGVSAAHGVSRSVVREAVRVLESSGLPRVEALRRMVAAYAEQMHANNPVHTWELP